MVRTKIRHWKRLNIKLLLALVFTLSGNYINAQVSSGVWNTKTEKELYDYMFNDLKKYALSENTRNTYSTIFLKRFKETYSKGFQNVDGSHLKATNDRISRLVVKELNDSTKNYWTLSKEMKLFSAYGPFLKKEFKFNDTMVESAKNCIITQLKEKYPKGFGDVSDNVRDSIMFELGRLCGKYELKDFHLKWTPALENIMKEKMLNSVEFKQLDVSTREKLADCIIAKMKKRFPEGFKENVEKDFEETSSECLDELLNN